MKTAAFCLALLLGGAQGFVAPVPSAGPAQHRQPLRVSRAAAGEDGSADRKGFLQGLSLAGLGLAVSGVTTLGGAAHAQAASLSKVNSELAGYGLPPMLDLPGGFSPLVEVYGKTAGAKKERPTYLVQFAYPSTWVVSRPSVDKNGEEGTISAGDYQKGDSATFFQGEADGDVEAKLGDVIERTISQKSKNVYQNFKVVKSIKGAKGANGTQYFIVDFKYELLTGAGFTVDRKGVAAVTQLKSNVLALVMATTSQRYKKLGEDLRTMAESFRVYDGIAQQS